MRAALFSTMAVATIALASPLAGNDSATTDNSDTQVISEPETTLNELQSTVKLHTANISKPTPTGVPVYLGVHQPADHPIPDKTLSVLQNTTTTATTGNFTNNGNITGEFNLIALALYAAAGEDPPKQTAAPTKRSSRLPLVRLTEKRDDNTTTTAVIKCDGKCQLNVYQQMGDLTSEIAYTVNGAMQKNAVGKFLLPAQSL